LSSSPRRGPGASSGAGAGGGAPIAAGTTLLPENASRPSD
jgi:hypothetical protein